MRIFSKRGQAPRVITCQGGDGYLGELEYMLKSIREGTPPTVVTATDGLGAVEICEAEAKSIKTGATIPPARLSI